MSRKRKWPRATAVSAVLLVLVTGTAFAQTAPTVSNVRATQRGDGSRLVDIRYDLAHNAACTVWAVLSGDGGVSWSVPAMTPPHPQRTLPLLLPSPMPVPILASQLQRPLR